jgi:hypothetical protein
MTYKLFLKSCSFCFHIIFVLSFISCASQKNTSQEKFSKIPNWKNLYFFHAEDSTWLVKPIPTAGNQFSGIIYKPDEVKKNRQAHIYADPLSAIKIEQGKISVPMENIVKVENYKIKPITIVAVVSVVVLLFLIPAVL